MHHDDSTVLLLVYIVSRATVVSLDVWTREEGGNGGDGSVCTLWCVVAAAAGVRECVPCLLT